MKIFYERSIFEQPDEVFTRFGRAHINHRMDMGRKMICIPERHGVALVRLFNSTAGGWIVNLTHKTCTCLEWQNMRLPCAHAYCAQKHFKIDIGDLSYPPNMGGVVYAKESYKLCYAGSCRPVLLDDLTPDGSTLLMLALNKPGRPRKIRLKANTVRSRIRKQSRLASQSTVNTTQSMVIADNESDPNSDNSDPGNSDSEADFGGPDGDSILDSENEEPATYSSIARLHGSGDLDADAASSAAENEREIGVGQHSQLLAEFATYLQSNEAIGEAEFISQVATQGATQTSDELLLSKTPPKSRKRAAVMSPTKSPTNPRRMATRTRIACTFCGENDHIAAACPDDGDFLLASEP